MTLTDLNTNALSNIPAHIFLGPNHRVSRSTKGSLYSSADSVNGDVDNSNIRATLPLRIVPEQNEFSVDHRVKKEVLRNPSTPQMEYFLNYAERVQSKPSLETVMPYANLIQDNEKHPAFCSPLEAQKRLFGLKNGMSELLSRLPKNLMIGGSSIIRCLYKKAKFEPHDLDIYMMNDGLSVIEQIDAAIRATYKTDIIMLKNAFTINWFLKDAETRHYPTIQLITCPVSRWGEVFASYHSDHLCVGYSLQTNSFVYANGRWDNFFRTEVSHALVPRVINSEEPTRVMKAIEKHRKYGFSIVQVETELPSQEGISDSIPNLKYSEVLEYAEKQHNMQTAFLFQELSWRRSNFTPYKEAMPVFLLCAYCHFYIKNGTLCTNCEDQLKLLKSELAVCDREAVEMSKILIYRPSKSHSVFEETLQQLLESLGYWARFADEESPDKLEYYTCFIMRQPVLSCLHASTDELDCKALSSSVELVHDINKLLLALRPTKNYAKRTLVYLSPRDLLSQFDPLSQRISNGLLSGYLRDSTSDFKRSNVTLRQFSTSGLSTLLSHKADANLTTQSFIAHDIINALCQSLMLPLDRSYVGKLKENERRGLQAGVIYKDDDDEEDDYCYLNK